jgi:flagellar hook-associated protein 3 FlgL
MVMRVATFALSDSMVAAALRAQAKVANLEVQSASGEVSSDFGGLGNDAKKVVDLQVSIAQSKAYDDAASSANDRVQAMYSATGSIVDLLTSYKSDLTGAQSTSSDSDSLVESAQSLMDEVASALNTQYGGRYLFGGSRTETAPVDLTSYPDASATGSDTSYYQGNDQTASVRVSDSQTIDYGVTADASGFEQALRSLSMIANASSVDSDTISNALDLATSALDAVTGIQASLSLKSTQLENASGNQQDYQSYASNLSSSLTDVDVASVTAKIATYQSQLEASYSALSKILSLRLSDYLK